MTLRNAGEVPLPRWICLKLERHEANKVAAVHDNFSWEESKTSRGRFVGRVALRYSHRHLVTLQRGRQPKEFAHSRFFLILKRGMKRNGRMGKKKREKGRDHK